MSRDFISGRVREERERLGLSQQATANLCGVVREMVGRWERGTNVPGGEALAAMMRAGADINYILLGQRVAQSAIGPLTPDEAQVLERYRALSAEQRGAIAATLLALNEAAVKRDTHPRVRQRRAPPPADTTPGQAPADSAPGQAAQSIVGDGNLQAGGNIITGGSPITTGSPIPHREKPP